MSELQQEVPRRKRRSGEEFKRDAVRLVVEEGYTFQTAAAPWREHSLPVRKKMRWPKIIVEIGLRL